MKRWKLFESANASHPNPPLLVRLQIEPAQNRVRGYSQRTRKNQREPERKNQMPLLLAFYQLPSSADRVALSNFKTHPETAAIFTVANRVML